MQKSKKPLKHFKARHPKSLKTVKLKYYSLKQAQYFNPTLIDWEVL